MLGPDEVRELLGRHGLAARKSLGQNFVADPSVVEWIAEQAGVGPGDPVVEVGPGLGSLTLALAATGAHVLALEKDDGLVPVLRDVLRASGVAEGPGDGQVTVQPADALEVDWSELLGAEATPGSWTLVANLPYNVAVPVVMSVLAHAPAVGRLVVMVQKEVADRLAAGPGGRTIGLPSLRTAWYASARVLGEVPPEAFVPQPRVVSSVVAIEPTPCRRTLTCSMGAPPSVSTTTPRMPPVVCARAGATPPSTIATSKMNRRAKTRDVGTTGSTIGQP